MSDFGRLRRSMNQIMSDFMDPYGTSNGFGTLGGSPFVYGRHWGQDPFIDDFSGLIPTSMLLPLTTDSDWHLGQQQQGQQQQGQQQQGQQQQRQQLVGRGGDESKLEEGGQTVANVPSEQRLGTRTTFQPARCKVNVEDQKDKLIVSAELPGLDKENISLDLDANTKVLSIAGQQSEEQRNEDKKRNYVRVERSRASFQRQLKLPSNIDAQSVSAKYENGVLHIEVAKKPIEASSNKISVQ